MMHAVASTAHGRGGRKGPTFKDKGLNIFGADVINAAAAREQAEQRKAFHDPRHEDLWQFLTDPNSSTGAYVFATFTLALIVANIVTMCVETVPGMRTPDNTFSWDAFEVFSIVYYTLEIVAKLVACPTYGTYFADRLNHIDIIAVLPKLVAASGTVASRRDLSR